MYKTKIFFGNVKMNCFADQMFNEWIEENKNIEIIKFDYQFGTYGNHSIAILYREVGNV